MYYLIDQYSYWLLILYIKMPRMLKYQLFDDGDSEEKVPRVYKRLQIEESDNKE